MKRRAAILAGALTLLTAGASSGQTVRISHARFRTASLSDGLEHTIRRLLADSPGGSQWMAWEEPMAGQRYICCFDTLDDVERSPCGGRCFLQDEHRNSGFLDSDSGDCAEQSGTDRLLVFVRFEGKEPRTLRTFSQNCSIDAGGSTLVWLTGVAPADSVAFLVKLVDDPDLARKKGKRSGEPALSAIAFHDDPSADLALEKLVGPATPEPVRRQAAFWLGNARGRRGFEVLRGLARSDPSEQFRKHVAFALSQSKEPEAVDTLIGMARSDRATEVRGQALFWLAQKAGRKAASTIENAINDDPETEVKKKAVFALTQLPKDEGVPELIRVARTNRNPAVRKQAVFWLGQSRDPRALAFFEEILLSGH